jgi:hypothetical protein
VTEKTHLTTTEAAAACGAAAWQIRVVADALGELVPRAGQYRLIPVALLPRVEAELRSRGYLPAAEVAHAG